MVTPLNRGETSSMWNILIPVLVVILVVLGIIDAGAQPPFWL